jgi:hypothetical protein
MSLRLSAMPEAQRIEAVSEFNACFAEMERVLWCLSVNSRAELLDRHDLKVAESLVWTVKSWWGVQGVRTDTRALMAGALLQSVDWSPALFTDVSPVMPGAEEFACECVFALVEQTRSAGAARREFSLASKVLHWLLPYHVPAYDSYVCKSLGIRGADDHPERAYREVAHEILGTARTIAGGPWVGALEPRSPVRALDKCLWWLGGGNDGNAAQVRDPWRVVDKLGLEHE